MRIIRENGEMLYEVKLVCEGMEYTLVINAKDGTILSTEAEEYVELDVDGIIDDFCKENGIDAGKLRDEFFDKLRGEGKPEQNKGEEAEKPLAGASF